MLLLMKVEDNSPVISLLLSQVTLYFQQEVTLYGPCPGLLIDCFKTIEYFRFRFWSQNHCLFFFDSKIYCISDCLRKGRIIM